MPHPSARHPLSPAETPDPLAACLPLPMPAHEDARMLMIAARRMAVHGLHDASAALLVLRHLGIHFRQPLVLMRAFMLELSDATRRPIMVAPCCTPRLTRDEGDILATWSAASHDPAAAMAHLGRLTGGPAPAALLTTGAALANALANAGRALPPWPGAPAD
ncbi:MAG TPA: DUF6628 family protein [Novosphingobium sp.]|nr:DUF6628 family protein [Novosphingobium sp.]